MPVTDAITVTPDSTTARPEVAIAASAACCGVTTGTQFFTKPHEDEERIVDRQCDAEHRHRRRHEHRHRGVHRQQVDQSHRHDNRADAEHEWHGCRGQRAEHREQHNQDDRKVPLLGLGDVVLGGLRRGRAERALPDDVQLDLAVLDLAGVLALDPDLLAELLGDVDRAGVLEVQLQGDDVRPVGLGCRLLRVGHHRDAGHFGRDALQLRDRDVHVVKRRVCARGRDQRQRRGALIGEVLLELALHPQRLRPLDLETPAGEVTGLVHCEIDRRHQEK